MQDNFQLSFVGRRTQSFWCSTKLFHSKKACRRHGFCTPCATSAHAAVHSIPIKKELSFLFYMDTNTGSAEVPCHGIILDGTSETCCTPANTKNITYIQNKYYNWKLCCVESGLDGRIFWLWHCKSSVFTPTKDNWKLSYIYKLPV